MHLGLLGNDFFMQIEEIITALKQRRQTLAVTQEHLAELSGVALRTIKEIERGQGNPTFTTLSKLADVLGMEIKMEVKQTIG